MPIRFQVGLPGPWVYSRRSRTERAGRRESSGPPLYVRETTHYLTRVEATEQLRREQRNRLVTWAVLGGPVVVAVVAALLAHGHAWWALAVAGTAAVVAWAAVDHLRHLTADADEARAEQEQRERHENDERLQAEVADLQREIDAEEADRRYREVRRAAPLRWSPPEHAERDRDYWGPRP